MNKNGLLLVMIIALSACKSMEVEKADGSRAIYNGNNSVLYQAQREISSPDEAMRMAAQAYQAGDLDQSLFQYLRALELDPKRYEALVWVGRIHRERGNFQLAELAFNEVLASAPNNPDALAELGLLNLAGRNPERAQELLFKAVALDQQRQANGGISNPPSVAELKVDSRSPVKVYNGLGVLADLRNDFPQAEAYYRLALQIEPRSALVQNSLGYSFYLAGRWDEAATAYKRGITYDSGNKPLWRNYGLLLARQGRYEEALSAFEQIESRAEASNDVGYVCLIEGQLDQAEQFLRSAIEQSPSYYNIAWDNLNRVQQIRRLRQSSTTATGADAVAAAEVKPAAIAE
ncbi:tetratricopeptide repeat protein [Pseudomonas sp. N040]|uniref:tetratricopeptide repeat protein n=1 Tax=Pseudomonas sp. N040 TaxID=2785325 RepID=UPI0018A25826|nr:tetratricopeptide repeat protein [Pseudomonas sp. N040]MBF7728641.1 tetratricopeptide repeat protein [Pseudomonas sp. N040]MBW7012281.1 tetratricopeptide repeat protein [Pseudomonas sp. N040]